MNIRLRFTLILGSLVLGFCAVLLMLRRFAASSQAAHSEDFVREQSAYLAHWINTDARSWHRAAVRLAEHNELPPAAAEAWRLEADGRLVPLTDRAATAPDLGPDPGSFSASRDTFWLHADGKLRQVAVAAAGDSRLLLVRNWNPDQLARFGALAASRPTSTRSFKPSPPPPTARCWSPCPPCWASRKWRPSGARRQSA